MIPFDFAYFQPDSPYEAANTFSLLQSQGKSAVYYAGGSEIITMCRAGSIRPDAVIDIKNIPECKSLSVDGKILKIGSACTLNQIGVSKLFPLLTLACGRIADHTNQCRITLGGNLCGTIIYRETSLPLLLSEAHVTLWGPQGGRTAPFQSVFEGRMQMKPGEMVVEIQVPVWALSVRYAHIKQTANEKIDYPLVSVAAIWKENRLRVALSGVCSYPFRSAKMEAALNDRARPIDERVRTACNLLPQQAHDDAEGSGQYRLFVLNHTLQQLLEDWENGAI